MSKPLATCYVDVPEPIWEPLERVALLARRSTTLPSFHEGEFMYTACIQPEDSATRIHLYKHGDTRRYLNLDDAGHAYQYLGSDPAAGRAHSGFYSRHRSLARAIDRVGLVLFMATPPLFRSFPPEEWPGDDATVSSIVADRTI